MNNGCGAAALVEIINILGNNLGFVAPGANGQVPRVGLGLSCLATTLVVPPPHRLWVALPGVNGGHVQWIHPFPQPAVRVAVGIQPRLGRHPGTAEYHDVLR